MINTAHFRQPTPEPKKLMHIISEDTPYFNNKYKKQKFFNFATNTDVFLIEKQNKNLKYLKIFKALAYNKLVFIL
jgi:hypothetical protein